MARKNRDRDPQIFHHIYARTVGRRLTLVDYIIIAPLIGGILARYQFIHNIEIYSYNFLDNHFHLLVRAPSGNLDEFMENVMREISKRVNKLYRASGSFWADRYKDECIEDEEGALRCLTYILTNPVGHQLVDRSANWQGLNSIEQTITLQSRKFSFSLRTGTRGTNSLDYMLVLSPLPQFEHLSFKERKNYIETLIRDKESDIKKKFGTPLAKQFKEKKFGDLPKLIDKKERFFSQSRKARERRKLMQARAHEYFTASRRYRLGESGVKFPPHTFLPPLHRRPRLKTFVWAIAA